MKKDLINALVNIILVLLFILVGITCVGSDLFGMDMRAMHTIHNFAGALLIVFILVHIFLHLNWFKVKLFRHNK